MSNSRASTCSSRAGSNARASAARAILSSASLASISARSSAASASASSGWSAAPRSIRRAACRRSASAPSEPPSSSSSPVSDSPALRPACIAARSSARRLSSPSSGASRSISSIRMLQPFAVALGRRGLGAGLGKLAFDPRDFRPGMLRPAACRACRMRRASARWPLGLSSPRSSCWPWISTARLPRSRRRPAGAALPAMKARLPPSLLSVRRTISGSPGPIRCPARAAAHATG